MQTRLLNNKAYVEFTLAGATYLAPQIVGARYWDAYNKLLLNDFLNDPEFQEELKGIDYKNQQLSNETFRAMELKYGIRYMDRVKVYMLAAILSYENGVRIDVTEADRLYDVASLKEVDAVVNFFKGSEIGKSEPESSIEKSGGDSEAQQTESLP